MQLQQASRSVRLLGVLPAGVDLDPVLTRALDVMVAAVLLALLAPLLLLTALLIRLDSPGPALFTQERVGRNGKRFRIWKFRTMFASSDQRAHQELAEAWFRGDPAVSGYRRSADLRVTRAGRYLRSADIDELPQLLNVLRGE